MWEMIITNEEILRKPCEDVSQDEVSNLISLLENELSYCNSIGNSGVGLAAPQIGIHKKISIIRVNNFNINLVNAKIEKSFDPLTFNQEGCLSFPNKLCDTIRYQEVYITNNLVSPNNFIATGLISVICQHEIDHYNGILFFDRKINSKQLSKSPKIGPNDPCICGSKRKYKKCCGIVK